MTGTTREPVLAKGDRLGERWEIIGHIATGGKGEVYRARQTNLDREVAIKIVSPELIEAYEGDQEEIDGEMARFRREVLAMARARHPNVLTVFDFETAVVVKDGLELSLEYIVMEYVPGPTLGPTIPEDGLQADEAALRSWITRYFLPILDGVEHIHRQGIIHRDLKPGNVLLDGDVPRITDFGLVGGRQWEPVTRSHHVIGTLTYMAPEQDLELATTDTRADVYSLGKILYHAAVGKLGKGTMYPLQMARLPGPDTPFLKALDRIIRRTTAEDRNQRLPSVRALREEVRRLVAVDSLGRGRRPRAMIGLAALALVLAGLLAAAVIYHFRGRPRPQPPVAARVGPGPVPVTGPPPAAFKAADGADVRLVPAGRIKPAGGQEKMVPPFYPDETRVTNHQFVEFLNANLARIKVADGLVRGDGRIWLYLGELRPGVEPIVYRGGTFRITDAQLAAHPVYRVTAHGATAYAAQYGRRLPYPDEWRRAA
jgi:serine/threonine protein kinase